MWLMWFGLNFIYYGMVFILPFFLSNLESHGGRSGLLSLIITTLGETSSIVLALFLIDNPKFGRKNTIFLGFSISSIACFIAFFEDYGSSMLIPLLTIGRFFAKMCFAVIYPLTAELYPTIIRTLGVGMASSAGRIGSCLMPFISIELFYINSFAPFLLFSLLGGIAAIGTLCLPFDTRGRYLDQKHENYYVELSVVNSLDHNKVIFNKK